MATASMSTDNTIAKDYTTFNSLASNRENNELLWRYTDALTTSICSIRDDNDLDGSQKIQLMNQSLSQFNTAMIDLFKEICGVAKKPEPVYELIEEVQKFNPYHDARGRFAPKNGGSASAGAAGSGTSDSGFGNSEAKTFAAAVSEARESCPEDMRWRVTAHTEEELKSDYAGAKLHVTSGGSTVAVAADGDIVSVCKKQGDTVSGKDLLKMAVDNGGTKLDSFSGNHGFYTKCGFEPVSWTPFNEAYAPPGWVKGRDKPEPIVFYKYKGGKVTTTLDEFLSNTKPFEGDDGYDRAMKFRNDSMEG